MSTKIQIQRLGASQWQLLKTLRLKSIHESPTVFECNLESILARDDSFWREQVELMACFVAYSRDLEPRGAIGLVRGVQDPSLASRIWLLGMWVDPKARGHGVGEALTNAVCEWGRDLLDTQTVSLKVKRTNSMAIKLYEKVGFKKTKGLEAIPDHDDSLSTYEFQLRAR